MVLFLTPQDLSGSDIKEKHKQVFEQHINDLLIIDESHFGARAQSYGEVIYSSSSERKNSFNNQQQYASDDNNEINALDNLKALSPDCTLHLSGTPYRILMGNEFSNPKQIVGKYSLRTFLMQKLNGMKNIYLNPNGKIHILAFLRWSGLHSILMMMQTKSWGLDKGREKESAKWTFWTNG